MSQRTPQARDEQLLLARISEAAGAERLGRRRATYPGTARPRRRRLPELPMLFRRFGLLRGRAHVPARLDLYEHGLTVATGGRIHVVRYDATSLRASGAGSAVLTDTGGAEVALPEDAYEQPQTWLPEVLHRVTRARP